MNKDKFLDLMQKNIFNRKKNMKVEAVKFVEIAYMGLLRRHPEERALLDGTKAILNGLSHHEFIESITESNEYKGIIQPGHIQDFDHTINKLNFIATSKEIKIKNIIYFVPGVNKPIGGVKVIARHCEHINSLSSFGINAQLFFPSLFGEKINWFTHSCPIKTDNLFNISTDLVIIPELWAISYGDMLREAKISSAIMVQNGYYVFQNINCQDEPMLARLLGIYNSARKILTISDDTTKCIKQLMPDFSGKIVQFAPSVDPSVFYSSSEKENIISFMPRKLFHHSSWLISQLVLKKLSGWSIIPIDRVSEERVAEILRKSKIFLSFADQEGFALPPLEAAMCGNIVIGYTGQAAREYWKPPLFREVISGDMFTFLDVVTQVVSDFDSGVIPPACHNKHIIDGLIMKYSSKNELIAIKKFLQDL